MLLGEEVSDPKTINVKQYLSSNNFWVHTRQFVMKSFQITQLYITNYLINNSVVIVT